MQRGDPLPPQPGGQPAKDEFVTFRKRQEVASSNSIYFQNVQNQARFALRFAKTRSKITLIN